jgi:threonine dehydratase
LGIKAHIFVPTISSPAKVARIAGYGATIVQEGANYQEAVGLCQDYVRESGALNIHAYDMETTLAGQGTLARELEEQAPDLDTVLVAVGGGGLIGGIASWYQSKSKVVGVSLRPAIACMRHLPRAIQSPLNLRALPQTVWVQARLVPSCFPLRKNLLITFPS